METEITSTTQPSVTDLQEQLRWLRKQLTILLVLAIFISGTFTVFLLRQWKYTHTDLEGVRPQATQMLAQYNQRDAPVIENFINNLRDYGKGHSDFMPILIKYGLGPTNAAPVPAAAR